MTPHQDDAVTSVARVILCGELARHVLCLMARAQIDAMPLKGALLLPTVYAAAPEWRRLVDVDVLVRPRDLRRALTLLDTSGYQLLPGELHARGATFDTPFQLHLDVHTALYAPFVFRTSTDGLFARARRDAELFGVPTWLPDPYDLYAHLLGHFAKGRLPPTHPNLADLPAVAGYHALDPRTCAQHLTRLGLARAARYVLGVSERTLGDGFAAAVQAELPVDRLGTWLASAAEGVLGAESSAYPLRFLAGHALNTSLPRAALAASHRVVTGLRRRAVRPA